MSDDVERRLKEFPRHFPRPDDGGTRRFEQRLRARLRPPGPNRRFVAFATTAAAALAAGAALGAGVATMTAGAATDGVTLTVRPTLLRSATADAFGSVSNRQAGEEVVLEMRECGQSAFRVFSGATTAAGGAYTVNVGGLIFINAVVRARWMSTVSEDVEVKRVASVGLSRKADGRFVASAGGLRYFGGKRVRIERWDRRTGRWIVMRQVTLERGRFAGVFVFSLREFRLKVGKGALLRAVFPSAQARPCYVGGVSRILRT